MRPTMCILPTSCTARNEVTGLKSLRRKKTPNLSVRGLLKQLANPPANQFEHRQISGGGVKLVQVNDNHFLMCRHDVVDRKT